MGRSALVPAELTSGPFTLADARRAGLERWHLEGANWRRIGPAVYVWAGLPDLPEVKVEAAYRRLPPAAAFSGLTAAWLHGLDVDCEPFEVTISKGIGGSTRAGLVVRRAALGPGDVVNLRASNLRAPHAERSLSPAELDGSGGCHGHGAPRRSHSPCRLERLGRNPRPAGGELCRAGRRIADGVALANGARPGRSSTPSSTGSAARHSGSICRASGSLLPGSPARNRVRRGCASPQPGRGQPPPEPTPRRGNSAASLYCRRCPPESGLGHDSGAHDARTSRPNSPRASGALTWRS